MSATPYSTEELREMLQSLNDWLALQSPETAILFRQSAIAEELSGTAVPDRKDVWAADVRRSMGGLQRTLAGALCLAESELKQLEKEYGPAGSGTPQRCEERYRKAKYAALLFEYLMAAFSANDLDPFKLILKVMRHRKAGKDVRKFRFPTGKRGKPMAAEELRNIFPRVWVDAVIRLLTFEDGWWNVPNYTPRVCSRDRIKFSTLQANAEKLFQETLGEKSPQPFDRRNLREWLKKEGLLRFVYVSRERKHPGHGGPRGGKG